jgi:hypothetical protein
MRCITFFAVNRIRSQRQIVRSADDLFDRLRQKASLLQDEDAKPAVLGINAEQEMAALPATRARGGMSPSCLPYQSDQIVSTDALATLLGATVTQIINTIIRSRWLAVVAATITIAACDGGPATIATASPDPVAGSTDSPATSPSGVGTATLSWVAPDQNTDGSALTNLAGYRIYYGTGADALTEVVEVPTVGITEYVIDNLAAGTYYFSIRAYSSVGIESALSNIVSDTIGEL